MIERAAEPGAPEDDVGVQRGPVGPPHAVRRDLAEHRMALEDTASAHGFDRGCEWQTGDRDDGAWREATSHSVLHERDRRATGCLIERAGTEFRRAPRDPRRRGHARDLVEQLDRRDAGANYDDVL